MGEVRRVAPIPAGGGSRLLVHTGAPGGDGRVGDSIAVSGVCLTVVEVGDQEFEADLSIETLRRTTLGDLKPGDLVNLERPLRLSQRIGGHFVQGHVDGVGTITALRREGSGTGAAGCAWMEVRPPDGLRRYLAEKGSVAVDGVSLTVAGMGEGGSIAVALIPHTLAVTTLGHRHSGDRVNLEADVLAKYIEGLLREGNAK